MSDTHTADSILACIRAEAEEGRARQALLEERRGERDAAFQMIAFPPDRGDLASWLAEWAKGLAGFMACAEGWGVRGQILDWYLVGEATRRWPRPEVRNVARGILASAPEEAGRLLLLAHDTNTEFFVQVTEAIVQGLRLATPPDPILLAGVMPPDQAEEAEIDLAGLATAPAAVAHHGGQAQPDQPVGGSGPPETMPKASGADSPPELQHRPGTPPERDATRTPEPLLHGPLLSATDIARQLGVKVGPVESFLRRFRGSHPDCCQEFDNPRKNEPRFLYRVADVLPFIQQRLAGWRARPGG